MTVINFVEQKICVAHLQSQGSRLGVCVYPRDCSEWTSVYKNDRAYTEQPVSKSS